MSRKGFTLIELLVVIVIIGILAAIAIPKFAGTKETAYVTAMRSDLRNLATAQEAYFYDTHTYTTDLTGLGFNVSSNVTVSVNAADAGGWNATATHPGTMQKCGMAAGRGASAVNPVVATASEGSVVCQ